MPWVSEEKCVGCELCVEKCPVEAISMENSIAKIDMERCIHCGTCHSVCPQEAVRHDGDRIPEDVKANVEKTKNFMELCAKHLGSPEEKYKCLERMKKYFNKEKKIAEKTLEELYKIKKT